MQNQINKNVQPERIIAHVDMDCFFVAVERLKDPSLVGKPVVVGGSPEGRGVISSASYEAREYGIHSAMPAARAKQLCADVIFVSPGFSGYDHYSRKVRAILEEYTPLVEMASIDEAYLDLTGTGRLFGKPLEIAHTIKNRIFDDLQLVASFGIASNKLIAKIASDYGKPNAITFIMPGHEAEFLQPMHIRRLPGIGPQTEKKLQRLNIETIGDLAKYGEEKLSRSLKERKYAQDLMRRARGEFDNPVTAERERKSISKEITFSEDIYDIQYLLSVLHHLAEQVTLKLRILEQKALTINIKYRYRDFETHTRAQSMAESTDLNEIIYPIAAELFENSVKVQNGIRLIGVGVSNLDDTGGQLGLFQVTDTETNTAQRTKALDELREKYGFDSVLSGQSLNLLKQDGLRRKSQSDQDSKNE